jgi:carbon-monoxide dehydrogenase medium subunit
VRSFVLLEPGSPQEASRMIADNGEDSRLLAGGTALLLAMRQRLVTPSHLIHIGALQALQGIDYDQRNGLRIGALVRHAEVAASPTVQKHYPMLASMAGKLANPQIRNMGTLGGNLCYADPATDPPVCLIALGARLVAVAARGERVIGLDEFYAGYYETTLQPDEVVTRIEVPPLPANARGVYTRFLRTAAEHRPLVGLGVLAHCDADVISEIRIAIGASTPTPVRARKAETFLRQKRIAADTIQEAARIAAAEIEPIADFRGSADYRREMVRVVTNRTLESALHHRLD